MPQVRKLTQDEVAIRGFEGRLYSLERYRALVCGLDLCPGTGIELDLMAGEESQYVRSAFRRVLGEKGLDIRYTLDGERIFGLITKRS